MAIANIVTNKQDNDFSYGFNVVSDLTKINKDIPTLVIGYFFAKENGIEIKSVFDRVVNENIFWTFDKSEKRIEYDKDYVKFIKFCINNIESRIKYFSIDVTNYKLSLIKNVFNYLKRNNKKTVYKGVNAIYISNGESVLCIDLNSTNYIGISDEKVITKIKEFDNVVFYENKKTIPYYLIKYIDSENVIPMILYKLW